MMASEDPDPLHPKKSQMCSVSTAHYIWDDLVFCIVSLQTFWRLRSSFGTTLRHLVGLAEVPLVDSGLSGLGLPNCCQSCASSRGRRWEGCYRLPG